jgi:hypothetical protein
MDPDTLFFYLRGSNEIFRKTYSVILGNVSGYGCDHFLSRLYIKP